MTKLHSKLLKIYNTLYITYFLLYCKGHIQITSNDNTTKVERKQWSEQNHKITFNTLKIYITIYHTYNLLYYKGHI